MDTAPLRAAADRISGSSGRSAMLDEPFVRCENRGSLQRRLSRSQILAYSLKDPSLHSIPRKSGFDQRRFTAAALFTADACLSRRLLRPTSTDNRRRAPAIALTAARASEHALPAECHRDSTNALAGDDRAHIAGRRR